MDVKMIQPFVTQALVKTLSQCLNGPDGSVECARTILRGKAAGEPLEAINWDKVFQQAPKGKKKDEEKGKKDDGKAAKAKAKSAKGGAKAAEKK